MSLPILFTLLFPRYSPESILKVKVTGARSKVKAESYHGNAHLCTPKNVSTKYQLPTPYGFLRYSL